jgi:hypothetical protein
MLDPFPSLLAARRARAPSPPFLPLYPGAKKPPSVVTFLPPSSALSSSHRSPRTTFATCLRRQDPRSPLPTAGLTGLRKEPSPTRPHGELHPLGLLIRVEAASHLPLSPPVP